MKPVRLYPVGFIQRNNSVDSYNLNHSQNLLTILTDDSGSILYFMHMCMHSSIQRQETNMFD